MAKILVADDNSNIQKMVGLALKDQGIDVVAVGNGEAAVRKISDVRPDLVLADVFMPVRNGYEVCKYVKGDASLAHIPVILLVGAFDPLDEQEAQRVGADGVLKKPFVPPDPLISMVKSALVRASAGQVATMSPEKAAPPAQTGQPVNVPAVAAADKTTVSPAPLVEDIPQRPAPVKIDSGSQPLAFGSLLETPPAESEDDAAFVTPNKELLEREWHAGDDEEEEEEEEESDSSSWRRDGGSEAIAQQVEDAKEKSPTPRKKRESWTPTREKQQELIEAEETPEIIQAPWASPAAKANPPAAPVAMAPAVLEAQANTATPIPPVKAAPPVTPPLPVPVEKRVEKKIVSEPTPPIPVVAESGARPAATPETFAPGSTSGKDTGKTGAGNSWFSVTSSPWEAEAQKASQLASTWDAAPAVTSTPEPDVSPAASSVAPEPEATIPEAAPAQPEAEISYDFVSEEPSSEPVFYTPDPGLVRNEVVSNERLPDLVSDDALSLETVETIRQETAYALEDAANEALEKTAELKAKKDAAAATDMDALVARVLAKMSPELLQAVTREILKPVVEAMVRDEMDSKK